MRVIQGHDNVMTMMIMYGACLKGYEIAPRGSKIKNVRNMAVILDANQCPITSFHHRGLNIGYAKKELLWYLGADAYDDSIEQHATMWKKLKQQDGSFYSNYGQYIFGGPGVNQFEYVVRTLSEDRDSRRACMVLLKREHLYEGNTDTVCTYALNFSIEDDQLHMTAMMRSNDVVFGFTNDAFCFWNIMAMLYAVLKTVIPNLQLGQYTHFTNSMHVYERHYDMLRKIVSQPTGGYYLEDFVMPTADEALDLVATKGQGGSGAYVDWLKA